AAEMTLLESLIVLTAVLAALGAGLFAWSYRRLRTTRAQLVDYLRTAAPEITVLSPTGVGFRAQVLGTAVDVDLATLARRRPARLTDAQWFDAVIDGIRAQIPTPAVAPYPLVEDRLMPLLKPAAYVALFERYRPALRLAWERFASDLAVTYVIAAADRRTTVTSAMLEAWGIKTGALHKRAMDNLRKQTVHLLTELGGPRARYEHIDGYDATRILVADLIVPVDIADPLVAIPEETVLLVAPSSDRSALAAESARRHTGSARPLTPLIFRPESVRSASSGPTATTPTSPSSS
ncbi:MAG TPA: hypothetical protein VFM39_04400, partial [bacterium]|nr:hypothetical protein [bacterium]